MDATSVDFNYSNTMKSTKFYNTKFMNSATMKGKGEYIAEFLSSDGTTNMGASNLGGSNLAEKMIAFQKNHSANDGA